MRDDPLIFAGCAVKRPNEKPDRTKATTLPSNMSPLEATGKKGDLLVRNLWQNGTESVHDMHVMNTDVKSHSAKTQEKFLHEVNKTKKKIYL